MHVLIASYSSSHSAAALEYGLELVQRSGATGTLVYVVASPNERERGHKLLQTQAAMAAEKNIEVKTELRLGQPAEQIVHLAYEAACDLIILAAEKSESLFGPLLSPPSERVLANAPCPVLLVRAGARPPLRLLVLHGGSQAAQALPNFLNKAGGILTAGCEVTLLHVMSQMRADHQVSGWELSATAEELMNMKAVEGVWLDEAIALFQPYAGVQVKPKVRHGLVVEEILAEAEEGEYDVLVLGRHASSGWSAILADNITKEVLEKSKLSLLVFGNR